MNLEKELNGAASLAVSQEETAALVAVLRPLAEKAAEAIALASEMDVRDKDTADRASVAANAIAGISNEIGDALAGCVSKAHLYHKAWTALRKVFLDPLDSARGGLRARIKSWKAVEELRAEQLRRKLQAEADAKARKDREELERRAAKVKTEAKREELREMAAQIEAPVISVEAPKVAGFRASKKWAVVSIDQRAFIEGAAKDKSLIGFVEISPTALARAKQANAMFEAPGVVFELRTY